MTQELQVAISRGDTARVAEVCKAFGHSDVVADMFLAEFNESRSHRYDWGTITDRELQTLVRDYLSNGYITMRKPLAFSSDRSFATNQNRATPISFERAQKACRNPNVPDYFQTIY